MTAIFTGLGAGISRGSAATLGANGVLGNALAGRGGDAVSVNAATGNLVIARRDEFLSASGVDAGVIRTYNSLGEFSDRDNDDNWQMATARRIFGLSGTAGTEGSTVRRLDGDGAAATYAWNSARGAYVTTDGGGAYDTLALADNVWTWTDGDSQITETYRADPTKPGDWRLYRQRDENGNALTFSYASGKLSRITADAGDYLEYLWSGNRITGIITGLAGSGGEERRARTSYGYDVQGRLATVTVDLSPELSGTADGHTYSFQYDYGADGRIAAISQTDGSRTAISYDTSGRVRTLVERVGESQERVTSFTYEAGITSITGPDGQTTRMQYDAQGQLTAIMAPPAMAGGASQVQRYEYDALGNLTRSIAPDGAQTIYTYDANGNVASIDSPAGADVLRWYDAGNRLVREETRGSTAASNDAVLTSRFVFGAGGNLRFVIGADGTVREMRYNSMGQLTAQIGFADTHFPSGSNVPTVAEMEQWRDATDKTRWLLTRYAYDIRGNLAEQTEFAATDADGAGALYSRARRTFFTTDHEGRILSKTELDGVEEHYLYDGLGRVIASSVAGDVSTVQFEDAAARTVVRTSAGLTRTFTYNRAGDLVSEIESAAGILGPNVAPPGDAWSAHNLTRSIGGGTFSYTVQDAGPASLESVLPIGAGETAHLRLSLSGNGAGPYRLTLGSGDLVGDAEASRAIIVSGPGQLVRSADGGWLLSGTAPDLTTVVEIVRGVEASGSIAARVQWDGPAGTTLTVSGASLARTAADQEAAFSIERIRVLDAAGRLRASFEQVDGGRHDYRVYDAAGRLTGAITDDGALTEYTYDANNRLIATVRYGQLLAALQVDALADPDNALIIADLRPAASDGDLYDWRIYDAAGRIVQTVNGAGEVTSFAYDGSGRLIRTTIHGQRMETAALRLEPPLQMVQLDHDPADAVTRNFYDAAGRVIGVLDGEGNLAATDYDAAGRKVAEVAYSSQVPEDLRGTGSLVELRAAADAAPARITRYVYDQQSRLAYTLNPLGQVTAFGYDRVGRLVSTAVLALPVTASDLSPSAIAALLVPSDQDRASYVSYDAFGRVASSTDAVGLTTRYEYDAAGRVVRTQVGEGSLARITRNWYDARGNVLFVLDPEGYLRGYAYTEEGRLASEVAFLPRVSPAEGAELAAVRSAIAGIDSAERVTVAYGYDALGRRIETTDGEGTVTRYAYDAGGKIFERRDAFGAAAETVTRYGYDRAGRVVAETLAYGTAEQATVTYKYDALGNRVEVTDARGNTTSFAFDHLGRMVATTDAAGNVSRNEYDSFGAIVRSWDRKGIQIVDNRFDQGGRLVSSFDAEGVETSYTYTRFGEVASMSRAGATTRFEYDRRGLVTRSEDALGGIETFRYDGFGKRISSVNKLGGETRYTYDLRGQLVAEYRAQWVYGPLDEASEGEPAGTLGVTDRFEYDALGNLVQEIKAVGREESIAVEYRYDKAGRLISTTRPVAERTATEVLAYDALGRVTMKTAAGGGKTTYYYDDLGRVSVEISAEHTYTTYDYDANGNVTRVRIFAEPYTALESGGTVAEAPPSPAGDFRETLFFYDDLDRLVRTEVTRATTGEFDPQAGWTPREGSLVTTYRHDASGNVVATRDPNGLETRVWYDLLGRKVHQLDTGGYRTDWEYDAAGNVTREIRYANAAEGAGDAAAPPPVPGSPDDRITNYTYDLMGNRLSETRMAIAVQDPSSVGTTTLINASVLYAYNALGQVTIKTEATWDGDEATRLAHSVRYDYDSFGHLRREFAAEFADYRGEKVSPEIAYRYDGLGELVWLRRVGATGSAPRTTYNFYKGGQLVRSRSPGGLIQSFEYDRDGNQIGVSYRRTVTAKTFVSEKETVVEGTRREFDHLGRVTAEWSVRQVDGTGTQEVPAEWEVLGPVRRTWYNAYGQVEAMRSGDGTARLYNRYDNAGRLIASNAEGGLWSYYGYDANGNRTAALVSAGLELGEMTAAEAFALVGAPGVAVTYTVYDSRNHATAVYEPGRQLSDQAEGSAVTLLTERGYNAFGEAAWEAATRADGSAPEGRIDYTYNTAGRVVRVENPLVEIVNESGSLVNVRAMEQYYYDAGGRLVAQRDARGAVSSRQLLNGTGYGQGEALVTREVHADGGEKVYAYDIFGDQRTIIDELGRQTHQTFTQTGKLKTREVEGSGTIDKFRYDQFGRLLFQIRTIAAGGELAPYKYVQSNRYDYLGRIVRQEDLHNKYAPAQVTLTAYDWVTGPQSAAVGNFGGWRTIVTDPQGRTSTTVSDLFERTVSRTDKGGHLYTFRYDAAGRIDTIAAAAGRQKFAYYNTGKLASHLITTGNPASGNWTEQRAFYRYDAAGNLVYQRTADAGRESYHYSWTTQYRDGFDPEARWLDEQYEVDSYGESFWEPTDSQIYSNEWERDVSVITAKYDALGRMSSWSDRGSDRVPAASARYAYDANGNIITVRSTHTPILDDGSLGAEQTSTARYGYDSMNRVVSDGAKTVLYDDAGRRVAMERTEQRTVPTFDEAGGTTSYQVSVRESYTYGPGDLLTEVHVADNGGAGQIRARFRYDLFGRVVSQEEYGEGSSGVVFYRGVGYNEAGQTTSEYTSVKRSDGLYTTQTSNWYAALGGELQSSTSTTRKDGANAITSRTVNSYVWYDSAVQSRVSYDSNVADSQNPLYASTYNYTAFGQLTSAQVNDGRPRTVSFANGVDGQVLRRQEVDSKPGGDPVQVYYRFGGKQLGVVGNDGTTNVSYRQSIAMRTAQEGEGAFRGGRSSGTAYADFGLGYDALNSFSQGAGGGSYQVQRGDSLQSIAMALWGDAALWYKLAEANPGAAQGELVEGAFLTVPAGVTRVHHNARTLKPYDPAAAIGDTSPTTPAPQKQKNKCGVLGAILLAVVAVAVTIIATPIATAALGGSSVLGGAAAAAAGSVVSQGVGLATGIQDKFSFKSVGLAALGGAVSGAVQGVDAFGKVAQGAEGSLRAIANAAVRGAMGSAITQGIGVATGLQDKFSWAGVAAAGVAGGVGQGLGKALGLKDLSGSGLSASNIAAHGVVGTASLIASAATRSAVEGSSFGDNITAGLPDLIAQIVGRALGDGSNYRKIINASTRGILERVADRQGLQGDPREQMIDQNFEGMRSAVKAGMAGTPGWEMSMVRALGDAYGIDTSGAITTGSYLSRAYGYDGSQKTFRIQFSTTFSVSLDLPQETIGRLSRGFDEVDKIYPITGINSVNIPNQWNNWLDKTFIFAGVAGEYMGNAAGDFLQSHPDLAKLLGFVGDVVNTFKELPVIRDFVNLAEGAEDAASDAIYGRYRRAGYSEGTAGYASAGALTIGKFVIGAVAGAGAFALGAKVLSRLNKIPDAPGGAAAGLAAKGLVDEAHVAELVANGVKFTPDALIATGRNSAGQVVFLESGNARAGLQHIVEQHGSDFAKIGVPEADIPSVVMRAVTEGKVVGYQGRDQGRAIYEMLLHQQNQRIAVSVGNNGFIVGANPAGRVP